VMAEEHVFISGNEAVAVGARLSRPHVISAYPITPQTVVVESLSEMVEDGSLQAEFMHVESEHSAISAAMGVSAVGARAFTATSSQGLLYMAEGMYYAAGGRFPIVMMNANRSLALPWSIYGDQSDSLSQLNSGWIQVYVEDAQEALDMVIQAYRIAEDPAVLTPFMVNLDGFVLTHTYERVLIPDQDKVDTFLPPIPQMKFITCTRCSDLHRAELTLVKTVPSYPKDISLSSTPTRFTWAQARMSSSTGNGRMYRIFKSPTRLPSAFSLSTTTRAVPVTLPRAINTTSALSQRYWSTKPP